MPVDIRNFFSVKSGGTKKSKPEAQSSTSTSSTGASRRKVGPNDRENKKQAPKKKRLVIDDDTTEGDETPVKKVPSQPPKADKTVINLESSEEDQQVAKKAPTLAKKRKDPAPAKDERVEVSASDFFGAVKASPKKKVKPDERLRKASPSPPRPLAKRETIDVDADEDDAPSPPKKAKTLPSAKAKTPTPKKKATPKKSSSNKTEKKEILVPTETAESIDTDGMVPECLAGTTFVFSGELPNLSREDGQEMVKILGGRVTTAVSSRTDYLVVGDLLEDGRAYTEGSKYKKAMELKKHVIKGEEALFGLIKQYDAKARKSLPPGSLKPPPPAAAPPAPAAYAPVSAAPASVANPYASKPVASNPYLKKASNPYMKKLAAPAAAPFAADSKLPAVGSDDSKGLWVDRYKPASSKEILGNQESVRKLAVWLERWEERFNTPAAASKTFSSPQGPWKAVLLSGPPGIGKTTTATLVAKESGRDLIEFNASDVRSKKSLQSELGDITGSKTLEFRAQKGGTTEARKKRVIVMDEVDGMGAGDRSGMSELIQMIKKSKVPIVCICNDRQSQKMKSLLPYCMDLRYRRPTKSVIATRAMDIAKREGLTVERNAAEAVAESCGNDVRQVINCLQMWASNNSQRSMTYKSLKERENSINKDEILRVGLFDAARTILEGRKGLMTADAQAERSHFFKRNDAFFVDYNFVGLLVQQNYLKVMQEPYNAAKRSNNQSQILGVLERMHAAAESMSDFTMAENCLRSDQNWSLLPFTGVLAVKTGFHAGGDSGGFLPGYPEFTTWLGRNSTKGKKQRLLSELQHHMNYKISGGTREMRLSYLPVLRERFLSLVLQPERVGEAIDLMDDYGLDRDDVFEKMDEFSMDPKAPTFAKLDSKKKAAFTRAYNEGVHKSQALVAEQGGTKKVTRKASSVSETIDPDAIDDDHKEEDDDEEDESDEQDLEKLKAMFKKSRRRKGGGATTAKPKGGKKK